MWSSLLDVGDQILSRSKDVVQKASVVSKGKFFSFLSFDLYICKL
jgi:hypothetical protein